MTRSQMSHEPMPGSQPPPPWDPDRWRDLRLEQDAMIKRVGWMVQLVGAGPDEPQFAYTVGLTNFGHPEIMVYGLPFESMGGCLNNAGYLVKDKDVRFFSDGIAEYDEIATMPMRFIKVSDSNRRAKNGMVAQHLGHWRFQTIQMIWPDEKGRWPWDTEFTDYMRPMQPLQGPLPEGT